MKSTDQCSDPWKVAERTIYVERFPKINCPDFRRVGGSAFLPSKVYGFLGNRGSMSMALGMVHGTAVIERTGGKRKWKN